MATKYTRTNVGRRVFDDSPDSRTTPASRFNRDRNESPSGARTTPSSVASKFNKMSIDDRDKDEHDDRGKEDTNEEEAPSRTRIKKDTGRSRAEDDGDNEEKEGDEDAPKKSQKKASAGAGAGKRRKEKKNLREKRRSTGVVIMPGQPADANDEAAQAVAANTAANMDDSAAPAGGGNVGDVSKYQETINQLQDELAAKVKELDTMRAQMDTLNKQNTRLKDENSALLRVVGSLSGTGGR
jgi:hypothetical protein